MEPTTQPLQAAWHAHAAHPPPLCCRAQVRPLLLLAPLATAAVHCALARQLLGRTWDVSALRDARDIDRVEGSASEAAGGAQGVGGCGGAGGGCADVCARDACTGARACMHSCVCGADLEPRCVNHAGPQRQQQPACWGETAACYAPPELHGPGARDAEVAELLGEVRRLEARLLKVGGGVPVNLPPDQPPLPWWQRAVQRALP